MSVTTGKVFEAINLRSSTPAPNEKVLSYLEGMSREGEQPDDKPPRSIADSDEYRHRNGSEIRTPPLLSPRSQKNDILLEFDYAKQNGNAHLHDEINGEDADSNVQEGVRSEAGDTALPIREPGPHDPPGPKYESYDSGPSFGNFGPLPMDDHPINGPFAHSSWNPHWAQITNKAGSEIPWNIETPMNGNGFMGLTPGQPAKVPLPPSEFASPRPHSVNIDVESPSSKSKPSQSQLASKVSQKATSALSGGESPKSPRTPGPPRSQSRATNKGDDQRPLSPLSGRSKVTREGTVYPPLPESRFGDDIPTSPKSRARSKAPSISPSDSPSQVKGTFASPKPAYNALSRSPPPGSIMSGGGHQSRPFSPYRHAPTTEDLLHAAVRGRALAIPEEEEKEPSVANSKRSVPSGIASPRSKMASQLNGKVPSQLSAGKPPSVVSSRASKARDPDSTPTPTRPQSPDHEVLDPEEAQIVRDALAGRTPRTSYYAASLEPNIADHFHDVELCVLLHQETDVTQHDFVRKALRKAIRQRIKKLGMKYDTESIRQYKKSYHDHDPSVHLRPDYSLEEPPKWASDIKRELVLMQQRIESLGPKIEGLKGQDRSFNGGGSRFAYEGDEYPRSEMTQTVNIQTQPTGTMADSMYHENEIIVDEDGNEREFDEMTETQHHNLHTDGETRSMNQSYLTPGRDDSPGQQLLEEELYKLRQKPRQSGLSHRSWEVARDDEIDDDYDEGTNGNAPAPSGMPTIPDTNGDTYPDRERSASPPLPALPDENNREMAVTPQGPWHTAEYGMDGQQQLPPWQRIHARLLSWAIIWPSSEIDQALNSTTRGHQVDEVALSIWSTQTYKRYVRARLTDSPQGVVDRLFVPPNMADAISNAVFNGRHGDACGMLRDLWSPFGLEGMPRLLVVLAKHRSDPNHWVVHRFSLPDGSLTTYDSYPERTLPDGRPLGWWFAIRVAWPNAIYPSPDHLMQKMVRLHRPMQLPIDNSVAAAGIWRNILMGSRAERSLDLERLRDLINTEVKNLRQRKQLGKLSIGAPRPTWEDMN